jgi:hypothetical protein
MVTRTRVFTHASGRLSLIAVLLLIVGGPFAPPARADYQAAEEILESGTLGGVRGLRVRRVGAGSADFSKNGGFVYYPASSMKVLEHFYAMVLVKNGIWTLNNTSASVCAAGTDNCGSLLNAGAACGATAQPLATVLDAMMTNSSNEATNAIQERVGLTFFPPAPPWIFNMAGLGRGVINQFATDTLGMTSSAINHKFGCVGFCGNPSPNALTLVDIERLYKEVATNNALLTPAVRLQMHDLMLNESGSFLDDVIDQEAAATGKNFWKEDFRNKFFQIYKGGNWSCSSKTYRAESGLVQLPTYNGAYKRLYTWGVFTHGSEGWAYLDGTMGNAARELLRPAIRAALLTWGFDYAAAQSAAGAAQRIETLPVVAGSPAAALLADAALHLRSASIELHRPRRDYAAALTFLEEAARALEAARSADPARVPADLTPAVAGLAHDLVTDLLALAGGGDSKHLDKTLPRLYHHARLAKRAATEGRHRPALRTYARVAAEGARLIDWDAAGTPFDDSTVGFSGTPSPRSFPVPVAR